MTRRTYLAYFLVSVFVMASWVFHVRTDRATAEGGHLFNSIVEMAKGTTVTPFVYRRLTVDASSVIARLVPTTAWDRIGDLLLGDNSIGRKVGPKLALNGWDRAKLPLLLSCHMLIFASIFGYTVLFREFALGLYWLSPSGANLMGALGGLALLGGYSDWHYYGYPYDFPQAFLFLATLVSIQQRSYWTLPLMALASYSKETSLLLIPAYLLLAKEPTQPRTLATAAAMLVVYLAVQAAIRLSIPHPNPMVFWFPVRNFWRIYDAVVFDCWMIPGQLLLAVVVVRSWPLFPVELRRLSPLLLVLLGSAFFKGWIEERRMYFEMLPIWGLMVLQAVADASGLGSHLRARQLSMPPRIVENLTRSGENVPT